MIRLRYGSAVHIIVENAVVLKKIIKIFRLNFLHVHSLKNE